MKIEKEYRYSNYLDGRVISESDWLLQSSNFKGQIRDNLRKKFIPPIPHPIPSLLEVTFKTKTSEGILVSETLAKLERGGMNESESEVIEVRFGDSPSDLLIALCLNPEIEIIPKTKQVEIIFGEIMDKILHQGIKVENWESFIEEIKRSLL